MVKFKKGQQVIVISGKEKGKIAEIETVFPKLRQVILKGVNIVKKHQKKVSSEGSGQIVDKQMPLFWSKLKIVNKAGEPVKVSYLFIDGKKKRVSRINKEVLE